MLTYILKKGELYMKINNMIKKFCIITLCLYISYYAVGRLFVNASTTSDTNDLSDDLFFIS